MNPAIMVHARNKRQNLLFGIKKFTTTGIFWK
jgi:hypothetical protein